MNEWGAAMGQKDESMNKLTNDVASWSVPIQNSNKSLLLEILWVSEDNGRHEFCLDSSPSSKQYLRTFLPRGGECKGESLVT